MPPKTRKIAKKAATSATKAPAAKVATKAAKTKATTQKEQPGATKTAKTSKESKKRSAEPDSEEEIPSKKHKADSPAISQDAIVDADHGTAAGSAQKEERKLDDSIEKELQRMREVLADHTLRSMGALMDAINFTETRPETVEDMIDTIVQTLTDRALDGHDISKDMSAFEKVDLNHWDGEYDSDPDGLEKIVRRRLISIEEMVGRLTQMYLKDIAKQLGFYARSGTNKALAAEIVAMLEYRAKEEHSKLKKDYITVRDVYSMCYGGCREESGLDGGDSSGEEDDEEGYES